MLSSLPSSLVLVLVVLVVLGTLVDTVRSQTCQVSGAWAHQITGNSVVCDGSDACKNATISGCDTVTCGERDCTEATIINSSSVICQGESACRRATIGSEAFPVNTVTCQGKDWTCYEANIFANTTVICEDNSGEGLTKSFGICAWSKLSTPCLQCIGTNHGCGPTENCKLNGEACPEYRYGGSSCEAACPDGQECKMNSTTPTGESSGASYHNPLKTTTMQPIFVLGIAMSAAVASWIL